LKPIDDRIEPVAKAGSLRAAATPIDWLDDGA